MCVALTHVVLAAETLALVGTHEARNSRANFEARPKRRASPVRCEQDLVALKIKTHLN
jgi:hypothetical protein